MALKNYLRCERCHIKKATGKWRGKDVCTGCYKILIKDKRWTEKPKKLLKYE